MKPPSLSFNHESVSLIPVFFQSFWKLNDNKTASEVLDQNRPLFPFFIISGGV